MKMAFLGIGACVGLLVGLSDSPIIGAVVTAALAFVPAVYQRFSPNAPPDIDEAFIKRTFSAILLLVFGITVGALSGLTMRANNVLVKHGFVRDYESFLSIGASHEQAMGFVSAAFTQGSVSPDVTLRSGTATIAVTNRKIFHDSLRTLVRSINAERSEADQQLNIRLLAANESALSLFEVLKSSLDPDLGDDELLLWSEYFFLAEYEEEQWIAGLNALRKTVLNNVLIKIQQ